MSGSGTLKKSDDNIFTGKCFFVNLAYFFIKKVLIGLSFFLLTTGVYGQVGIGILNPDSSSELEVNSSDKGFLPPRLTNIQRDGITRPAKGLMIYNTTKKYLQINIGSPFDPDWKCLGFVPEVESLDCSAAVNENFTVEKPSNGKKGIIYKGGNAGNYNINLPKKNGLTVFGKGILNKGEGSLELRITGIPEKVENTSFTVDINGVKCSFEVAVKNAKAEVASFDCSGIHVTGTFVSEKSSNGKVAISYKGGNGGDYDINLPKKNGLTVFGKGILNKGEGSLELSVKGTPKKAGKTSFKLAEIKGDTCEFDVEVENAKAEVASFECSSGALTGTFIRTKPSNGKKVITYEGGNGGDYSIESKANGLTVSGKGTLQNGKGSLELTITGTPDKAETTSFTIEINGKKCEFKVLVENAKAEVTSLDCSSSHVTGTFVLEKPSENGKVAVSYKGGNGGDYNINLAKKNGLTVSGKGTLNKGEGSLELMITGTPEKVENTPFIIDINGVTCSFEVLVENAKAEVTYLACRGEALTGTFIREKLSEGTKKVIYKGGNGGDYDINLPKKNGLTVFGKGILNKGEGSLELTITGTPEKAETTSFTVDINGVKCSFEVAVKNAKAEVASFDCSGIHVTGTFVSEKLSENGKVVISYKGGNGGDYDINLPKNNGLTVSGRGTLNKGEGILELTITGTPEKAENTSFTIDINGVKCSFEVAVKNAKAKVASFDCSGSHVTGTFVSEKPSNGKVAISYKGGNGGDYNINLSKKNGLTVSGKGILNKGEGSLELTITGTPEKVENTSFTIDINEKKCEFKVPVENVLSLNCSEKLLRGTFNRGKPSNGKLEVSYKGGNGESYNFNRIKYGLTISGSGRLNKGDGSFELDISGTPEKANGLGNNNYAFDINIGGERCTTYRVPVINYDAEVESLDCSYNKSAAKRYTYRVGDDFATTASVAFKGGNGGAVTNFQGQEKNGLRIKLDVDKDLNSGEKGDGIFVFSIIGKPERAEETSFTINIGGKTCEFTILIQERE